MRTTAGSLVLVLVISAPAKEPEQAVDFGRDVRPIFARHCHSCHGEARQRAGLRLDRRPDALLPSLLTAGKSADSRLIHLVTGKDPSKRMPPQGPRLDAEEVAVLRSWIDQGGAWPASAHWSLLPLRSPAVPTGESHHPIDRFIWARLAASGLSSSPPADRRTLIRRLTFNLHGLPPAPEEIADYQNDPSVDAYERLVDRLLASPRYGERWARHWLDIAHWAETHGHDQDSVREHAWPYRDYLIRSLNADKPYARFIQEQIATDVLFPEEADLIPALGFLSAGPWDESSQKDIRDDTIDKKQAQYIDRDDIITTVFTAVASTSIHCARCHDHKFDPISQKEYYGLQASFAGVERANRTYDADITVARARRTLARRKADLLAGRIDVGQERAAVLAWEQSVASAANRWKPLQVQASAGASKVLPQADHSILFTGTRPDRDTYTLTGSADQRVLALRLEVLTDPSLPHNGPGRQDNGNLHLSEVRIRTGEGSGTLVPIASAVADFNQAGWDISRAIDGDPATAWGIYPAVGKPHQAVFELKQPIPPGVRLSVELDQLHGGHHLIGRLRLSTTSDEKSATAVAPLPAGIASVLKVPVEKRTPDQWTELTKYALLTRIEADLAALPPPQQVYAGTTHFEPLGNFKAPGGPRPVQVLKRGDVTKPGDLAVPGVLSCVQGPGPFAVADITDEGQRRAAVARWLSAAENGLVWRSIVNRVWHYHFGRGIVNTPNDFGRMGSDPSHPELLDWLAVWFRDRGGSLKELHRLIVTSDTYRQQTAYNPTAARLDVDNTLLWRMNRARLDAESIRDAVLHVSDKLDSTMGGPSARHFSLSPGVHVTPVVDYQRFDLDSPAARRRSIYRFVFRTLPDPLFEALDCPDASQFAPVRSSSVTALQALALLNDRFMVRYAEHFAARLEAESEDVPSRIRRACHLALGRAPADGEVNRLRGYVERHGLANACRLLLNSNEFLYVD